MVNSIHVRCSRQLKDTQGAPTFNVFNLPEYKDTAYLTPFPLDHVLISQFEKRAIKTPKGRSKRNRLQWERKGNQGLTVQF